MGIKNRGKKANTQFRKFALTVHVTVSIGWIGAVFAYLALVITTLTSRDAHIIRAALISMEPITYYAVVPLALASLLTGLFMSLSTTWGLFRHYWILAKFLLTIIAIFILFQYTQTISLVAELAREPSTSLDELKGAHGLLHSVGALVVLLLNMILSMYKPKGVTKYGWRKQYEKDKKL
ncbi:DUF2269 domain-containing protein [Bacillus sp. FJAT-44742]|uniref:DUF2269 domain-containing protein n=1 Tax=Bacillus sp. FJAT-44742 TaxID=2014005 RepID=UPI001E547D84|nr:DUF2269 domain-containing protein [Bacillus sp. FJAT-44742]